MIRRLSCLLVAVLILCSTLAVPAYAEQTSVWTELLEYSSVNDSGSNMFNFTSTITVNLKTPMYTQLKYVDIVFYASDGVAPTSVKTRYNSTYTTLTVVKVAANTFRAYGKISGYYKDLNIQFNAAGTQYYTIQSCKVSIIAPDPVQSSDTLLDLIDVDGTVHGGGIREGVDIPPEIVPDGEQNAVPYTAIISVFDAAKYDTVFVHGSVTYASIGSIRCTYGNAILPYTVSFIDIEADGAYDYSDSVSNDDFRVVNDFGKYMYALEIDMSGVDRTSGQELLVYMIGSYSQYEGMNFNLQNVAGTISIADVSSVTWWHKLTAFFTDLFNGDGTSSQPFENEAAQQGSEMDSLNQELENVTKPPVEDIRVDVDDYIDPSELATVSNSFSMITGDDLVLTMLLMPLTVALVAYVLFGKR